MKISGFEINLFTSFAIDALPCRYMCVCMTCIYYIFSKNLPIHTHTHTLLCHLTIRLHIRCMIANIASVPYTCLHPFKAFLQHGVTLNRFTRTLHRISAPSPSTRRYFHHIHIHNIFVSSSSHSTMWWNMSHLSSSLSERFQSQCYHCSRFIIETMITVEFQTKRSLIRMDDFLPFDRSKICQERKKNNRFRYWAEVVFVGLWCFRHHNFALF